MTRHIRTQALFDGVSGILDIYIEEAAAAAEARRDGKTVLLRFAAVAATVAVFLGCLFLFNPTDPVTEVTHYFVIKANADGWVAEPTYPDTDNPSYQHPVPYWPFGEGNLSFEFEVWLSNTPEATSFNTYVTVEYNNIEVVGQDDHILILLTHNEQKDDKCFYIVTGWFDEPTELSIKLYQQNLNTGEICLLQQQDFLVSNTDNGYTFQYLNTYINNDVSWQDVPSY